MEIGQERLSIEADCTFVGTTLFSNFYFLFSSFTIRKSRAIHAASTPHSNLPARDRSCPSASSEFDELRVK
jgi:hypothetical protein